MLKCTPSRYRIRQWACRARSRHASNCWVSVWLSRLIVLATSSNPHEGLGHFSHLMGTCPGHKHLCQPFCDVRFIAAVPLKGLGVELTFTISRDVDVLEPTCRCHQIARVGAVAIPFALGATLSPARSNELLELFTHHRFDHDPNGTLSERTQVLMEDLLFWQYRG